MKKKAPIPPGSTPRGYALFSPSTRDPPRPSLPVSPPPAQDLSGSTYLMQCSVLKPEMSLELVVKCESPNSAESARVIAAVLKEALARYLR